MLNQWARGDRWGVSISRAGAFQGNRDEPLTAIGPETDSQEVVWERILMSRTSPQQRMDGDRNETFRLVIDPLLSSGDWIRSARRYGHSK